MKRLLTEDEIASYHENGYIVVESLLPSDLLDALRRETDAIVDAARGETEHGEIYDLEDSHTALAPRVRRIKEPYRHFPFFKDLVSNPLLTDIVAQLVGPDVRLFGGKMNIKAASYGAPVEWHQDWAFYPHTNDDILATGILLDDCDESNGPLLVLPGSHKGPVYDHHADGKFCGGFLPGDQDLDVSGAVPLTGPAGSMTIHHVRAVHGSALNTSNRTRRLLLWEYAAADAWPLTTLKGSFEDFDARIVRGQSTTQPRLENVPVRMPFPAADKQGSIYENQKGAGGRWFETFEERTAART